MKLVVDIGNTKTKVGLFDGKQPVHVQAYTAWQAVDLKRLLDTYPVERGLLCTVGERPPWWGAVQPAEAQAQPAAPRTQGLPEFKSSPDWLEFTHSLPLPISYSYHNPDTLGCDRLAMAVALHALYPQQTVLGIGMGSCITYNLLHQDGRLVPGAISPGVAMRLRAMHHFTHALPKVDLDWEAEQWPVPINVNSTTTALSAGAVEGVYHEICGFIGRYRAEYGPLPVVLTGGDARYFEFSTKNGIFVNPNLVLVGLNEILDYNK